MLCISNMLERCHPSNRAIVERRLDAANHRTGRTLFDIIIEIINNNDNSGHDCALELVEETGKDEHAQI